MKLCDLFSKKFHENELKIEKEFEKKKNYEVKNYFILSTKMNPYLYGVRLPLFLEGDEVPQSEQIITIEQLDAQTITIPVSYTLLEVIQNATPKNGAGKHINALLDEIIKSPSFFFPDVPLVFERQGLLSFVPDDNQEHLLNWRSIILQAHISFLSAIGWENISRIKKSNSGMVDSNDRIDHNRPGVTFNSRAVGSRANYTTGSISVRSQSKCVASFTNRSFGIGSIPTPSFDEIQYTVAPQLDREQEESKDISQLNLELNQLFDFQLQTSFEAVLFKALVLTINSRGIFDKALGNVILSELRDDISNAGFQVGRIVDASQAFDEYYHSLQRTLLTPEAEQEIRDLIGRDDINPILKRFDQLYPFRCVPHAYYFIKSVLAPLCYHENSMIAQLATKQLMTLFNYHDWELHSTKVITADNQIEFERSNEHIILISGPSPYGNNFSTLVGNTTSFLPSAGGFYDFCYARVSSIGELEIDQTMPCGRYIVLPAGARKEIIHELPAFDDKTFISFSDLAANLETLANSGATAVHVTGVIERNFLHDLTSVTDHGVFSKKCGGLTEFKEFCERAKSFGLRVLIDFTPLVCLRNSSKKYAPFATLTADERGRLTTADIPETEMMLLNYRSLPFWDLLSEEILHILDSCGISGFYLGSIEHWDTVLPRDLTELMRLDPDDNQHYNINNIIEGAIVSTTSNENCNLTSRKVEYSPHLYHIMRKIWSKRPDAFVWVQCEPEQEPFVIKSGLIPANYQFRNVLQCAIEYCVPNDNVDYVNANENLIKLYEERSKRNPLGALHICPFGALMDGPYNLPNEGISLAIDALFYLTEVPLISGCLGTAMFYANAYSTIKQVREKNAKRPIKWWPPTQRFTDHLKNRSSTRMKADWALGGDVKILPVSYDSHPMRAILSAVRVCPKTKRSCLICTSYYMYNLIYEVSVNDLTIFDDKPLDSVVEVKPILGAAGQTTYYSINELKGSGSALFLELGKFSTAVYEISIITPPIPPNIGRTLMEHVYVRLQRAITYDSRTVLSNNNIFNQILKAIEQNPTDEQLTNIMSSLPQNDDSAPNNLREAFYYATRNKKDAQNRLVEMNDEDEIEKREHAAMTLLHRISSSKIDYIKVIGQKALEQNDLGPICFIAPELGPFSKVGGLSTMVWELAKELVNLGLDIHVISPYYNVSPKGETDYLKKYGVEYIRTIDVYVPDQTKIGIHYAVVDGVKCWFLHHYSFFAAPYPTGSCSFRLQLLVVMAKAALELLCQVKIIPNLIVSNDWMTGLVPAMGRKQFGSIFNGTKFLHIFHNLGVGYAGKIWPNNGDTGSLRYIHQLPDELIVDNFDHSIDPSLCSLLCADQWATASKKYRQELLEGSPYNWLLCRYPKPFAYSNGIRFQERLSALKKLNLTHLEAKRKVQQKYFGYVDDTKCLFVFVGRIVEQKGVYLIIDSFEELNRQYNGQLQFIVGGQAAPDDRAYGLPCTHRMWDLKNRYPKQFWADPSQFFSDGLLACQAADFTMIPSLFEPSGIVQQEAFASGCPVIAFKTGGLADTVFEFDREKHTGNGFVFLSHHHHDFIMAVQRAYDIFQNKELYEILRKRAFESTLSTETVAIAWSREFARLFMKIFEKKEVPAIESPKETKTETKVEAKAETKVETKAETKA
ncbi:glycosyl transferase [Tritrichomonas foetus]|uniref:Glycosyl transferase n=1 Tax=Tritrichomonas foetus TaxID=1144522 RepID=A0A1J4KF99_9EUKA|nr:glycosyl transferase [Tritrichomonas foetus]|eukprot:OHT09608.1 glycosyl transferase [Tritrichomonas foetus]